MMMQMIKSSVPLFALISCCLLMQPNACNADGGSYPDMSGYQEVSSNNYEPPPKTKFNIGFNLPAMSISLPKLELPQISIKASVKNKKPFTLKLPIIKFNAHANTEEEYPTPQYGGGDQHPQQQYPSGPGPSAYASAGNGISAYASSTDSYEAPPKNSYEAPASHDYQQPPPQNQYEPMAYASRAAYSRTPQNPHSVAAQPVAHAAPQQQQQHQQPVHHYMQPAVNQYEPMPYQPLASDAYVPAAQGQHYQTQPAQHVAQPVRQSYSQPLNTQSYQYDQSSINPYARVYRDDRPTARFDDRMVTYVSPDTLERFYRMGYIPVTHVN